MNTILALVAITWVFCVRKILLDWLKNTLGKTHAYIFGFNFSNVMFIT